MRKVLYFVLSSAIVGCQSTSMLSKGSSPVEIIIVSPNKGNVRITYLEHNLLNTIYVEGDSCRYNIYRASTSLTDPASISLAG